METMQMCCKMKLFFCMRCSICFRRFHIKNTQGTLNSQIKKNGTDGCVCIIITAVKCPSPLALSSSFALPTSPHPPLPT